MSTKLTILKALADKVDQLIVGGGIANTFMLAAGLPIGKSLAEPDLVDEAHAVIAAMRRAARRCRSRPTSSCAKEFRPTRRRTVKAVGRRRGRRHDPRHRPGDRRAARAQIAAAGTIVWNGPVGVFEFDAVRRTAPRRMARAIAAVDGVSASPAAATRWRRSPSTASTTEIGYISTGGGAFLEFLEGKTLPAFEILERAPLRDGAHSHARRRRRATPAHAALRSTTEERSSMHRATKIVATLGPASSTPEVLERMIRAGVDVVRLNFSHGTAQDHIDRADAGARGRRKVGKEVAIMADLQGPKIRVGKFEDGRRR